MIEGGKVVGQQQLSSVAVNKVEKVYLRRLYRDSDGSQITELMENGRF